jgi:uncharacterized membrane-anchored protein
MPVRVLLGGAVCLAILAGVMVGHAWPLWAGDTVLLRLRPVDPRDLFRGEYVRLDTPASRLFVVDGTRTVPAGAFPVRGLGAWQRPATDKKYVGGSRTAYVQLERRATGEHEPVSISDVPVEHAMNLRGEARVSDSDGNVFVDYGLDAFYMQEGTAKPVQDALAAGRTVQMQVAIASSGRSRIRTVLVEGVPVR